ncbi:porin [Bosea sp. R86505]|uniref:porin n=1 Tax=Bosea sp. R86505 TaxID=3101710 RepID=UPI0036728199
MKLVKSLLLGSAAGFAAVAGAQAADLPSRKAAPVEYVRVCSAYGAGFFYIPGTETCLRVGGRVRAEYTFGERWSERQDSYGTRALGRIFVDARTATAYGTLRTFIRHDINTRTGSYRYGALNNGVNPFSLNGRLNEGNGASLDKAFIQFGPITAGKAQSFFDFYANDLGFSSLRTSDRSTNLLAYTASFGGGFTATLSLEDGNTTGFSNVLSAAGAAGGRVYQGSVMPDIVASLRVDQGWGSAQLSGAVSDRGTNRVAVGRVVDSGDDFGFAIQGGVKFNLPMIAAGDQLWLQAAYADGAIGYLGWGGAAGVGRALGVVGDFTVNPITGVGTKSTTGFAIVAGFRHFWTPQIRSDLIASYSELTMGRVAGPVVGGVATTLKGLNPKELVLGANLVWSPVSGLDIGVEVLYSRVEFSRRIADAKSVALGGPARTIKSDDAFAGRLRIQRDF